ncbi:Rossmann-like and DUF2520 domain-containing protein [Myroides odoratus]|jgi:predicted short-subunit dehydrogenase-like oxidoreductase (DUF2520 family)|uniref:DUF2520 domain-containing protein n=1 Tax=Myroides odoratus TaxID=256 RepID=A0A9Q7EBH8_MYROD|nr:Rossmann-like and DUF2520 domain-containing protein [Myroides odoratus]EHQ44075.1 protein of unknown function DUF2520-containing protein [Myroides odoratus DSM 2801]EKB05277.1 hypothetical protein HMPREF9716_02831 [Myroides odoratus CIP 103059]QQU01369.1 DUF2520 domain-containing protein [Myroides odoratus]WQD56366.1 DUF2520 domain-containing protein [Myroides odoratus]STZ31362.1 Uncharacterized conserved protein [Myroides odoratus]
MVTITILGSGKVAHHLIGNILESDQLTLQQIYARNTNSVTDLVPENRVVNDIKALKPADIFIIAVSDISIEEVSKQVQIPNQFVVHTSGTIPMSAIQQERKGVMYMLQSFSKDKELDFSSIPFCIEANHKEDFQLLEKIAVSFSERVYKISSEQRKAIHLAAVFVNNFSNHMFTMGEDICKEYQVPFEILKPLILETANKIMHLSPFEAQTGPASRGDQNTINQHLEMLTDPTKKEIYQLITKSIQNR